MNSEKFSSLLNLDRKTAILETTLTDRLTLLEKINLETTIKNRIARENGTKIRMGFSSNYHNYKRNTNSFSIAEDQFRKLLEKKGFTSRKDWIHEYRIKVRDIKGRIHIYHIDFYLPLLKTAIEVNPLFHTTYETVAIRDKLKTQLLKRKEHIRTYSLRVFHFKKKGKLQTTIDRKRAYALIAQLKKETQKLGPHKETLSFWTNSKS